MPIPSTQNRTVSAPCANGNDPNTMCAHSKHVVRCKSKTVQKPNRPSLVSKKKRRSPLLTSRAEDEHWVDLSDRRLRCSRLGALYAGSKFQGIQKCGNKSYEVTVDIQHLDLNESMIRGYLNISGLTVEFPELTTYFEGEIIGPKYSFLTRKWQAQHSTDVEHWGQFPSFQPYISVFNQDGFVYDPLESDIIYMRWKEKFLVPDHRVDTIDGASFAGFYYICYQRSTNKINGFYFFKHRTEMYQELVLDHVEERCFGNFEFR
ncbi:GID complex subunit 4, VID24 [Apophysomyces sp. BC1034]|nr:GID complex subunit 4, VID24 [Apophysomyces sp. BC1015]KAG0181024.1 GID complex subunit 4, VID24 [Apophysomyces sp. BC1021]KAG0186933.1 GID complex subunit 4, VID24 [Apophysomyces sp. BC1034]